MEPDPKDVSSIQDEEMLRRMWQQTEDFGKKKEIRTHMYKLREARLKEFYTSGEVLKDVQRSNSSPGLREQHFKTQQWQEGPTHADSLADHSFLSLKSKEIRDSESPTRDVQYRNSKNRAGDGAWTISSSTEKSDDGKMVKSSLAAKTQGTRPIDGGNLSFAAANEQQTSMYSDGDANNFTKSLGESSKTFAHQDVTVGDDKNYHSSKSTTSSSSSKFAAHHSSRTGDNFDHQSIDKKQIGDGNINTSVTKQVHTSDIPDDLKKDILDGKTKVITETKTLPDGSTVTTTRYEIKGAKKWSSSSSSSQVSSNRQVVEERSSSNKQVEYTAGDTNQGTTKQTVVTTNIEDGAGNIKQIQHRDQPEDKTETIRTTKSETYHDNSNKSSHVQMTRTQENVRDVREQQELTRRTEDVRDNVTNRKVNKHDTLDGTHITSDVKVTMRTDDGDYIQQAQKKPVSDTEEIHTHVSTTKTTRSDVTQKSDDGRLIHTETMKSQEHTKIPQGDKIHYSTPQPNEKEIVSSYIHEKQSVSSKPNELEPTVSRPSDKEPICQRTETKEITETHRRNTEPTFIPVSSCPEEVQPDKKSAPVAPDTQPQYKESIHSHPQDSRPIDSARNIPVTQPQNYEFSSPKPHDKQDYKPTEATSDQYTTTYGQEYTNKRITVDVSPTHNAFARSLRSISPDRESNRTGSSPPSRASNRSLRTSHSSLRSSPEKVIRKPSDDQKPSRVSPDRRPTADRYSPERRTPDTARFVRRPEECSPDRKIKSPTKSPERKKSSEQPGKSFNSDTLTKRKPTDSKLSERPTTKADTVPIKKTSSTHDYSPVRTSSPTKPSDRRSPTKQNDRQSPTKTTELSTIIKVTRNQTSPERPQKVSPSRGTSPTKQSSSVKSPTKSSSEIITVNSDTITRRKKMSVDDVLSKSADTSTITRTEKINTDTIARKKEDSPENKKSPTKTPEKGSPVRSPSKTTTPGNACLQKKNIRPDDHKPSPINEFTSVRSPTKPVPTTTPVLNFRGGPVDIPCQAIKMPKKPEEITKPERTRSRSSSPTSSASDIEFIVHNSHIVTDLDAEDTINITLEKNDNTVILTEITTEATDKRPTSLNITPPKTSPRKQDTTSLISRQKSPTKSSTKPAKISPAKDMMPQPKEVHKDIPSKEKQYEKQSPTKQYPTNLFESPDDTAQEVCYKPDLYEPDTKPQFKRTGTYEEQCKKMLGLLETTKKSKENYAGREPVEEPLFVKKHIDISCREDELLHTNVEIITKSKVTNDENDILPHGETRKKQITEFITIEQEDISVNEDNPTERKPEREDIQKPKSPIKQTSPEKIISSEKSPTKEPTSITENVKKPADKYPSSGEASPTKIPSHSPTRLPSRKIPDSKTIEPKIIEKSPELKVPDQRLTERNIQQSKPSNRIPPEEYSEIQIRKVKPKDKQPEYEEDNEKRTDVTRVEEIISTDIGKLNVLNKKKETEYYKNKEEIDKSEYSTEYTDEYTKQLITSTCPQSKSPGKKPSTSPERKPVRESLSPDRKKSPKKKITEIEQSEIETKQSVTEQVTKKRHPTGKQPTKPTKSSEKYTDDDETEESEQEIDTQQRNNRDTIEEYHKKYETIITSTTDETDRKEVNLDYKETKSIDQNICKIPRMTERKEPKKKDELTLTPQQKPFKTQEHKDIVIDEQYEIDTEVRNSSTVNKIVDKEEKERTTELHYQTIDIQRIPETRASGRQPTVEDEDYLMKCFKPIDDIIDQKHTTDEFILNESTVTVTKTDNTEETPTEQTRKPSDTSVDRQLAREKSSPTQKKAQKQPETEKVRDSPSPDRKSTTKSPVKESKQGPIKKTTDNKEPKHYTTEYTDEYPEKQLPFPDRRSPSTETKYNQPIKKTPDKKQPEHQTTTYIDEYVEKTVPSTDRKSPVKEIKKEPQRKTPDTKQLKDYTSEYTYEYPEKTLPDRKNMSPDRKSPIKEAKKGQEKKVPEEKHPEHPHKYPEKIMPDRKSTSPDRKSPSKEAKHREPTKKSHNEKELKQYKTEYTDEYSEKTLLKKPTQQRTTEIPTTQKKKTIAERKPSKEISPQRPDNKQKLQTKVITKEIKDQKSSTTYTEDYDIRIAHKEIKPTRKENEKQPELNEKLSKVNPKTDDVLIKKPTKDVEKTTKQTTDSTNETIIDYTVDKMQTNKTYKTDSTKFVSTDFIGKEKYDTEITLDMTQIPEPEERSLKQKPNDELNLEKENAQEPHIRTHRIDTNIRDTELKEASPKRQSHKAVSSETTDCTLVSTKQNIDENTVTITSTRKTIDIRAKQKEKKNDIVLQKMPVQTKPNKITKKDIPMRGSPALENHETIKPEHPRSPSPATKISTRKITETDRTVNQLNRKLSPVKKLDMKPKTTEVSKPSVTKPKETPSRKPLYTSPVSSLENKPTTKPSSRTSRKDLPLPKSVDSAKKHVVTKTISLTSRTETKPQPSSIKTTPKTVTTTKTTKITQPTSVIITTVRTTSKTTKTKTPETYYPDSEPEHEDINGFCDLKTMQTKTRTDKNRVITTTDIKLSSPKRQSPVRERPSATSQIIINTTRKPSEIVTATAKKEKCITTKSIVLNKKNIEDREVIIDLQRSNSSREPSPEKMFPVSVSSEDESGYPRYPDQISEPDDAPFRKPRQKIYDIPLTEEADVHNFSRVTDITESKSYPPTRITDIDKVTEKDESLLSVTEKVSRFITTAEKLTGETQTKSKTPAPKVPRPELIVTDDLENDECLLSVSDKVSKFITTADEITTKQAQHSPSPSFKPTRDVKVDEDDECLLSVNEKVSHFIQAAETVKKPSIKDGQAPKISRPQITDIDEDLKTDHCLLSVSDKVSKFLTTADKLTTETFITSEKHLPTEPKPSPRQSPEKMLTEITKSRQSPTRKIPELFKKRQDPESESVKINRQQSPIRKILDIPELKSPVSIRDSKTEPICEDIPKHRSRVSPTRKSLGKTSTTEPQPRQSPTRKLSEQSPSKPTKIEPKTEHEPADVHNRSKYRQSPARKIPETSPIKVSKSDIQKQKQPTDEDQTLSSITKIMGVETKSVNLKSSEAVRKAKAMFENISKSQDVSRQRDILSRPSIWEGRKKPEPTTDTKETKLTDIGVQKSKQSHISEVRKHLTYTSDDDDDICKRTNLKDVSLKSINLILNEKRADQDITSTKDKFAHKPRYPSPERISSTKISTDDRKIHKSPERDVPGYMKQLPKIKTEDRNNQIVETRQVSQERKTFNQQKYSVEDERTTMTETRTKTKLQPDDIPGYMRPLQRCPTPERDPDRKPETKEDIRVPSIPKIRHTSPEKDLPGYMRPLHRSQTPERDSHKRPELKHEDITDMVHKHRRASQDTDLPGYMRPLQRQAASPDRDSERKASLDRKVSREEISQTITDDAPRAGKKFGVTLRRTDSGRVITTTTITERRRSSASGQPIIEDIEDLHVLEEMMDKVLGYEQRRRIRAQIRVVKRLISENKIHYTEDTHKKKKPTSPTREPQHVTRKSPEKDVNNTVQQTTVKKVETQNKYDEKSSTEQKLKYTEVTEERRGHIMKKETHVTRDEVKTSQREERMSPDSKKKHSPTSQVYKTDLRHIQPPAKNATDEKPTWVTNRNLKKTATESVSEEKRVVVPQKKKEVPRKTPSPQKDMKPTDCITSSYGIGPTDENGQPLFGIKALRRAAADKVHVRGTVMSSQFYSENGEEPVGEVTVTKYSSDPKELECDNEIISKSPGFASVTTTQKFGARGTPSIKTIVDKKKQITEHETDEEEVKTTTKVTRRGSVKALSQKFVENAVETSRNERQSYPRAGLILRTSSFKDTPQSSEKADSRESSPGLQGRTEKISLETITTDSRSSRQEETKTFLNSHSKVSSAQEVLTRMKNSEYEVVEDDTAEDKEARMLLNKFLGAQVLMSGMEPMVAGQGGNSSAHLVRKVQTTKTVKESSKPVTVTKRYQCPITPEILQDIWEEQTLRSLLEQCTNYEERRNIRARLRQVMAEQEAVANVVASAVAERECDPDRTSTSTQERIETKKSHTEGPVTTTEVSTRLITSTKQVSKPMSPFAKFRQLDKQNSLNTPSSPRTPAGGCGAPLFKFTDPALSHSASTVKDRLLHWCQMKTREYQNIKLENFSTNWADGLAFCALIHHFLPDAFDYHALNPQQRRHNFTLAFTVADEQAGIFPLLDVDDMVAMRRPDWKCVFTYVQSIYRRFKDED